MLGVMRTRTQPHELPYPSPQPEHLATAEAAATMVSSPPPFIPEEDFLPAESLDLTPEDALVKYELYRQMQQLREERNRALVEAEAWRQASLIEVVLGVAVALIIFWPF